MKKNFLIVALFSILLLSCEKEIEDDFNHLPYVDDVCSVIDDINFKEYCYDNFDTNKDGKVSMLEAKEVSGIKVNSKDIKSLKGIEYFAKITYLNCYENNLEVLDISNNRVLTHLSCGNNSLTTLDVSNNTALTYLECENNSLTDLDVNKNTALIVLYCDGNFFTNLNVGNNHKLVYLRCGFNSLSTEALNALFESLPHNYGYIFFAGNPGDDDCDRSIYEAKGWEGYGK